MGKAPLEIAIELLEQKGAALLAHSEQKENAAAWYDGLATKARTEAASSREQAATYVDAANKLRSPA